jgi:hypothetical protein
VWTGLSPLVEGIRRAICARDRYGEDSIAVVGMRSSVQGVCVNCARHKNHGMMPIDVKA